MSNYPAIIVLTGASGAGKTTIALKLKELAIPGVESINCDRIKIDTANPGDIQVATLRYWISHLSERRGEDELAVLDTQIRPHRALEVLSQEGVQHMQIVLVDCEPVKRNERLRTERDQPELATQQMDCWAAYLRGQADALNLAIIDTTSDSIDKSVELLAGLVRELMDRHRAA